MWYFKTFAQTSGYRSIAYTEAFLSGHWLRSRSLAFDVIDERQLASARLQGGQLWTSGGGYSILVLPGVSLLASRQAALKCLENARRGRLALFSGEGVYTCTFALSPAQLAWSWVLDFPSLETTLEAYLDGALAGRRGWPPYRVELPSATVTAGEHSLLVRVRNTASNRYHSDPPFQKDPPAPSGITAPPLLRPFRAARLRAAALYGFMLGAPSGQDHDSGWTPFAGGEAPQLIING